MTTSSTRLWSEEVEMAELGEQLGIPGVDLDAIVRFKPVVYEFSNGRVFRESELGPFYAQGS